MIFHQQPLRDQPSYCPRNLLQVAVDLFVQQAPPRHTFNRVCSFRIADEVAQNITRYVEITFRILGQSRTPACI